MNKCITIAWNLILIMIVALAASVIIPKILGQFQGLDRLGEGPFRDRTMMFGFQGIGLFAVIAAGALSLSTIFLRKVSWVWRGLFIALLAACIVATIIAIRIDQADMGFVTYGDYISFVGGTILISFPIVAFGRGYPSLVLRVYRRLRGHHHPAEEAAP
jgi:hypothetical protein